MCGRTHPAAVSSQVYYQRFVGGSPGGAICRDKLFSPGGVICHKKICSPGDVICHDRICSPVVSLWINLFRIQASVRNRAESPLGLIISLRNATCLPHVEGAVACVLRWVGGGRGRGRSGCLGQEIWTRGGPYH